MNIQEKIKNWVKGTLNPPAGGEKVALMHPKDIKNGDYSFFAGEKAEEYTVALRQAQGDLLSQIEKIEVAGNFVNFYLSKEFFANSVEEINKKGSDFAKTKSSEGKILIEHTQPNPFKDFHIGHLMNNAIGESIYRILKTNGADITAVGYHGDIGLHVAKYIYAIEKGIDPENAYAEGSRSYEDDKKDGEIRKEVGEINKKIYDKSDEKINKIYDDERKKSLENFERIYKKLDSKFDKHFYESEVGETGKEIVLKNKAIFEESEGAMIFRGENFEPKTHTRVFVNSDGIPTYEAKEVGLAKLKKEKYEYDKSITITANEQDSFFDVVEVAIGEVFPKLKGKLKHLSHGMLKLPSGKMSSRTGDVVTAENLINQVKEKIAEKLVDREYSEKQKEEISEIVSIGAIKYSILRQATGGDIIFDFDKSISFEGDSGPYLQYTAVRANSVLQRASVAGINSSADVPDFPSENTASEFIPATSELEKYLYRFPEIVKRAGKEYAPHHIVTYLTELSSLFNSFYAKEKIVDEKDPNSPYKIALTQATSHILTSGLHLLGIKVPEKM